MLPGLKRHLSDALTASTKGEKQGVALDLLSATAIVIFLTFTNVLPGLVKYYVQIVAAWSLLIPLGSLVLRIVRSHRGEWPFVGKLSDTKKKAKITARNGEQ